MELSFDFSKSGIDFRAQFLHREWFTQEGNSSGRRQIDFVLGPSANEDDRQIWFLFAELDRETSAGITPQLIVDEEKVESTVSFLPYPKCRNLVPRGDGKITETANDVGGNGGDAGIVVHDENPFLMLQSENEFLK
jgi:hypothetical protein